MFKPFFSRMAQQVDPRMQQQQQQLVRKPRIHRDFITAWDGDGINFNTGYRYKHLANGKLPRIDAKQRASVEMHQGQHIIHGQYEKNQAEWRLDQCNRLSATFKNAMPIENYFPMQQSVRSSDGKHIYRAPASQNALDFTLKRGQPVFEELDPITREKMRDSVVGASALKVSNIYNGLAHFINISVKGISQTEASPTIPNSVRTDITIAVKGTDLLLNTSLMYIPHGVYVYVSDFCCMTTDGQGNMIPCINTDTGEGGTGFRGTAFLPSLFYLQDNSIYSLEDRINRMILSMLNEVEENYDLNANDQDPYKEYCEAIIAKVASIADRRSDTFEFRQDFVSYELATVLGFKAFLKRIDCFYWAEHTPKGLKAKINAMIQTLTVAYRVLSYYGRERAEIVAYQMESFFTKIGKLTQTLTSDFLWTPEALAEKLDELTKYELEIHGLDDTDQANMPQLTRIMTILYNCRCWLDTHLETSVNQQRGEGGKILKRRYLCRTHEGMQPGYWGTVNIFA